MTTSHDTSSRFSLEDRRAACPAFGSNKKGNVSYATLSLIRRMSFKVNPCSYFQQYCCFFLYKHRNVEEIRHILLAFFFVPTLLLVEPAIVDAQILVTHTLHLSLDGEQAHAAALLAGPSLDKLLAPPGRVGIDPQDQRQDNEAAGAGNDAAEDAGEPAQAVEQSRLGLGLDGDAAGAAHGAHQLAHGGDGGRQQGGQVVAGAQDGGGVVD